MHLDSLTPISQLKNKENLIFAQQRLIIGMLSVWSHWKSLTYISFSVVYVFKILCVFCEAMSIIIWLTKYSVKFNWYLSGIIGNNFNKWIVSLNWYLLFLPTYFKNPSTSAMHLKIWNNGLIARFSSPTVSKKYIFYKMVNALFSKQPEPDTDSS